MQPPIEDLIGLIAPELDGRIDHILVRADPRYEVEPLELRRLIYGVDDAGKEISLSDHAGYLLRVAIRPHG